MPVLVAAMMLLYGISGAYQPAVQASMPLLCPPDRLVDGNAVINQVSALSSLLGPLLGSLVYGAFGVTPVLAGGLRLLLCFGGDGTVHPDPPYAKTHWSQRLGRPPERIWRRAGPSSGRNGRRS